MIEEKLIKLIKSLDRIMDTWDKLTLRRTMITIFSVILLSQIIITTLVWIVCKDIAESWVNFMTLEFGAWSIMIGFYFYNRGKNGDE